MPEQAISVNDVGATRPIVATAPGAPAAENRRVEPAILGMGRKDELARRRQCLVWARQNCGPGETEQARPLCDLAFTYMAVE